MHARYSSPNPGIAAELHECEIELADGRLHLWTPGEDTDRAHVHNIGARRHTDNETATCIGDRIPDRLSICPIQYEDGRIRKTALYRERSADRPA